MAQTRICIIGVGSTGGGILETLTDKVPAHVRRVCIDTDSRVLHRHPAIETVLVGERTRDRPFHSSTPLWCRRAALDEENRLAKVIADCNWVCVIAALGSGTGTGIPPVILEICKIAGKLTFAVVTHPFSFEGRRRATVALDGLSVIEALADLTLWIPYDRLRAMLPREATLQRAYCFADEIIGIGVGEITSFFHSSGQWILGGGTENLKPMLASCGRAVMGFGHDTTLPGAMRTALACPLLGDGALQHAGMLLVGLTVSATTALSEINETLDLLREMVELKNMELIWAITGINNSAAVTLFATRFKHAASMDNG